MILLCEHTLRLSATVQTLKSLAIVVPGPAYNSYRQTVNLYSPTSGRIEQKRKKEMHKYKQSSKNKQ